MSADEQTNPWTPELKELFDARNNSEVQQYEKLTQLAEQVYEDPNSRLPFIPLFYRTRKPEDEQVFLDQLIPKVYRARGQEFCLETCTNSNKECLESCYSFTRRAFEIGTNLYAGLHKPYTYTIFKSNDDEE